jgi:hypothetical protein
VGLAIGVRKKNAERTSNIAPVRSLTVSARTSTQGKKAPIQIGHALITLTSTGFYPSEITRPKGPFLLAVDNRAGDQDIALRLTRANGTKEKEKRMVKGQSRWRQLVDLNPGKYVLTEANHPDWVCNINITAN